jgi:hypothetical protein
MLIATTLLIGALGTSHVFGDDHYDKGLVDRAYHAADEGVDAAQKMHTDGGHNFGGHAEKAAEHFRKAHKELEEAEKYAKEHHEKKSGS